MSSIEKLKEKVRDIPDFPKKGILFRDITPILSDSELCKFIINELTDRLRSHKIDAIAGIESRGFLFGMSLAQNLNLGFIPVRKKGKLPYETVSVAYELEYGTAEIEMHKDAVKPGMHIHIHDDLLATGGTASAVAKLLEEQGAIVSSYSFLIELKSLEGHKRIEPYCKIIDSLIVY